MINQSVGSVVEAHETTMLPFIQHAEVHNPLAFTLVQLVAGSSYVMNAVTEAAVPGLQTSMSF